MPDHEKELDKYEKSVEDHVRKVSLQLDEELANIGRKYKEKLELVKKLELENKKTTDENERLRQRMDLKKKKILHFERQILKNKDNLLTFEATISDINDKLPQREKQIDEIIKSLNEKRRIVLETQNTIASFRLNKTENSMKIRMDKTKKKQEEMKKKKLAQDKKISRLRADIAKSEKSFDNVEEEIRKEIQRQFENESKKGEIQRRIKIFEAENSGISDEFQKLLISLNEVSDSNENSTEKRIDELKVLLTKGSKYLQQLEGKIQTLVKPDMENVRKTLEVKSPSPFHPAKTRRSKSEDRKVPRKNMQRLENLKKRIIQLKRESEALKMNEIRLLEEKETLNKSADNYQREVDRAAQNLRLAENVRISDLNQQERILPPSITRDSNEEIVEKERLEKIGKFEEKIRDLRKSTDDQKEELERIKSRQEFLKRQLKSYSEFDLVQFENEKNEKGAEIRNLKKLWHEQTMTINALNKKLQQRVLQREAAMTKANSVIYLTTNVRDERNREIEELHKDMTRTKLKF